jgi:cytochrome subunit of sulfide dehydrogenase
MTYQRFQLFSLLATSVFLLTLTSVSQAESTVTRGAMLANNCSTCHGPDGHSPGAIPSIAGKSADYIATAMRDFRAGTRPGTVMNRHAKGYSDEDIQALADYFSKH